MNVCCEIVSVIEFCTFHLYIQQSWEVMRYEDRLRKVSGIGCQRVAFFKYF